MTTDQQVKPVAVEQPCRRRSGSSGTRPRASPTSLQPSEARPYTAKCGKRCKGAPGVMKLRSELASIEKCVVCADLYGVEL